jgi:hypothetical protein
MIVARHIFQFYCLLIGFVACAQSGKTGYLGRTGLITAELSPALHLAKLDERVESTQIKNDWYRIPKVGIHIGWQKHVNRQWLFGISYLRTPDCLMFKASTATLSEFEEEFESFEIKAHNDNFQFYLALKKYLDLAPEGFYFGFKAGLSLTHYAYQETRIKGIENTNNNTIQSTTIVSNQQNGNLINPSIGIHLGKSFLLNKRSTLEAGVRTTRFLKQKGGAFQSDITNQKGIVENLYRMNHHTLNSLHTIEIYATFSLYY